MKMVKESINRNIVMKTTLYGTRECYEGNREK